MLIFVNITNKVISTKIWLLQTLNSVSTGFGQVLHPFLPHLPYLQSVKLPQTLPHNRQTLSTATLHHLPKTNESQKDRNSTVLWLKKNKAHYMVKTQKMTIICIKGTTDSLWTSTCSTSQYNPGHTATVNPQHCIPLITTFLWPLHSGHLAAYGHCYMNSFFN